MRTNLRLAYRIPLALLAAAMLAPAAYSHCGHCGMGEEKTETAASAKPHDCKGESCPMHKASCPAKVEGAEIAVTNTAEGVTIVIKAKDGEAVKKIQEAGAKMAKGECCGGHGHEHKSKKGKKAK
jgi:hypothetical protein